MHLYHAVITFSIFYLTFVSSQQTYCVANVGPSSTLDSNIGAVHLVGDSKTITEDNDCPGTMGVQLFLTMQADLTMGKSYSLMFTETTCGGVYPTLAGAWIDFNRDGTFSAVEQLTAFTPGKGALTIPFTVPALDNLTVPAVVGDSRLRVQVQETYQTYIDPCGAFSYGGTKDFGITIKAPGSGSKSGVSGGTIFLILLLIGVFLYIVIGASYNKFKRGTTGFKETCPHYDNWSNFLGYVKDGFIFTRSKCSRKGDDIAVYDSIDSNDI